MIIIINYFLLTVFSIIVIVAAVTFLTFKFDLISLDTDFESNEIKELNINDIELESIDLIPVDEHELKKIISNKNDEQKPVIFSL